MNFQQLRIIRETVRQNFNLTEVANALFTSQSGVSKHIKDLEEELGIQLYERRGKRLLGLTEPGKELAPIVERMLEDAGNIKRLAEQFTRKDEGELVLATTHTQARYVLPAIIARFRAEFPGVRLVLHQGSPTEIASLLQEGKADIGIATEAVWGNPDLVTFPYLSWHHVVLVAKGHPLEAESSITLETLARHPLITYHAGFTGRPKIDKAFAAKGLKPDIVMEALDADVIKAYAEMGLGIGIVASVAFDPARDTSLTLLPSDGLFDPSVSLLAVRRGRFLRDFATRFITLAAPELTEKAVRKAIAQDKG
jgi:LysR family cys regulon transcriptional activator